MQFKDQSVEELNMMQRDLAKEIFLLRNRKEEEGKLEKPSMLRTLKKQRAQVLTFLRQKSGSSLVG